MEVVNIRDFRNSNLTVGALRNDQYTFCMPRQEFNKRLKMLILWYVWKPKKEFY